MESLREFITLITKKRIKKAELFDESSRNKTSNYYKLFDGIHSRKYTSDEVAAQDIYGCPPSEKKYLILKTRLKQKLLNTLFFLDYEGDTPGHQRAVYECARQLYAVKILLMHDARRVAIPLAEKTLRVAQEFELTDTVAECAKIMREHCAATGQYQEFQEYKVLAERAESLRQAENLAEQYLQELAATSAKAKANRSRMVKLAETFHLALGEVLQTQGSAKLKWLQLRIKTLFHQFSDDYRAAVETIGQTESFLAQASHFSLPARLKETALQKMNYYLHLKDFAAGETHIRLVEGLFADDNPGKATLCEYRFLLAMHTGHYLEAARIFKAVVGDAGFSRLSAAKRERWRVFQAYLHYIYKHLKVREIKPLIQNSKTGFQLSGFIADKPEFAKEKRGLNIATLTVQILFLLEKMNTAALAEHIGAIEKYARSYPKKDIYFRSECFISLLAKMRDEDFRFYQTRKSLEKMFDEMCSMTMVYQGNIRALEVLPYEVLWRMVLEKLKSHKYG